MPAIISDQFRILNAETFVQSFTGIGTTANYYTFLGHPNPANVTIPNYGNADWPQEPKDSFEQEYGYHDSMMFMKRITSEDIARVVPRYDWQSGSTYDMYKHNYDSVNTAPQLSSSTLYEAKYVVINSEYKVYLCINNGQDPENPRGKKSVVEPNFVSTIPQAASVTAQDGYIWKYLYTISPADVIKFATEKYIPLPKKWGDANTETVKNASQTGKIETVAITNRGINYTLKEGSTVRLPILGDGTGGEVTITIANNEVSTATVTAGGKNYTRAFVRMVTGAVGLNVDATGNAITVDSGLNATFEVPIPPKGGHGYDIYRELGGHRVMVYSKYDTNADYIIGNDFSRIGIVKNPTVFASKTEVLDVSTATSLSALKMANPEIGDYPNNEIITQTVGVGSTAVGYVASYSSDTGVLRYYQPSGLSELSGYGYKVLDFTNSTQAGIGTVINVGVGTALSIDNTFDGSSQTINNKVIQFGQTFDNGKANPDVEPYSGEIIYVDNRSPITRSKSQKEELKIVVEF